MDNKYIVLRQNLGESDEFGHNYTLDFAEHNVFWSTEAACIALDDAIAAELEVLNASAESGKYFRKGDSIFAPDGKEIFCYTIQCLEIDPVEAVNRILEKKCAGAKWAVKIETITDSLSGTKYKWTGRKPKKDFGICDSPIDALRDALDYLDNLIRR